MPELDERFPVALTSTALAANATAYYPSSGGEDRLGSRDLVEYVRAFVWADQSGTLTLEDSDNGSTWATKDSAVTVTASALAAMPWIRLAKRHWRWKYVNGGTLQGTFKLYEDRSAGPVERADTLTVDLSFTSPASAATSAYTAVTGLGAYRSMYIFSNLQGGAGDTLDVYIQNSPDRGTTWVDYAHFAQLAAAASATKKAWAVSKSGQQTSAVTVGIGTSPALAANTIVGGDWGDRLRVVATAATSTSVGAAQTVLCVLTS